MTNKMAIKSAKIKIFLKRGHKFEQIQCKDIRLKPWLNITEWRMAEMAKLTVHT